MGKRLEMILPTAGTFKKGGPEDPLYYYYHPIVGCMYTGRINCCLSLLNPPYKRVLDVGYGSGILVPTLSRICERLVCIDRDTDPMEAAAALRTMNLTPELLKGDIAQSGLEDGSFDLVTAISVLEQVDEPEAVVEQICRLLRPGGELLVGMPRVDKLMEYLFLLIGYRGIEEDHVHTWKSIAGLLTAGGRFTLIRNATMPRHVPFWAALYYGMLFRKN